jgi:hypothetical protein
MEGCSRADLEQMYIDAVYDYYKGGAKKFPLSDEVYDKLKEELAWQGSQFPQLKRYEVEFVEASLSYAKGEPIMSDADYENLKQRVKGNGKREDVSAMLLYIKGQQLLDAEQYAALSENMKSLGIDVGLRGASCTLNGDPCVLKPDQGAAAQIVTALSAIPAVFFLALFGVLGAFGGPSVPAPVSLGLGLFTGLSLLNVLDLQKPTVLKGPCPCCETPIKSLFAGETPVEMICKKCDVCGTKIVVDSNKMEILNAAP